MKIKKNDTVLVIAGKDKGKKGKVLAAFPKKETVVVEGVNIQTHVSNVMYYDTKAKAPVRIGYKVENGHKKRISKKTGQVID